MAVGGLAARAFGATRDLVDLDFYVPETALPVLAQALAPEDAVGPTRVQSAQWDVSVLVVEIAGCPVEFGAAEGARWRDAGTGRWHDAGVDFTRAETHSVLGVPTPVMPRDELIAYKAALDRDVDLLDLHDLTGRGGAAESRLAVYGTLAPGEANHAVVSSLRGSWARGTVCGHLHAVGWGMTHGFPALVWDPDGPEVAVHVLESPDLADAWPRLDAFEGQAYRRQIVPVKVSSGKLLAYAYTVRWPA